MQEEGSGDEVVEQGEVDSDLRLDGCFTEKERRRLQRLMKAPDEEGGVHMAEARHAASWSHNNRLVLEGKAVTLLVFGVIEDCLWRTVKDKAVELRLHLGLLRDSDQEALAHIADLARADRGLDATLQTLTPDTVFAGLYDSVEGVRPKGVRKVAALNLMRAGDVLHHEREVPGHVTG
ncbi:hypothetical protein LXA43DRAFT_1069146 [Ganoderma leucocontextum]|nr:hypothetical protein LXA43DRAFT_1069146 [Ganoderma leucocontextum]